MTQNLKQLLLARADWFAREIMDGVKNTDYAYLTPAQSRLLAHMAGKPSRMSDLAKRLAISRQAVHKTVTELVRRGVLELQDDPENGQSRLVVYTEKGKEVNRAGVRVIQEAESKIAEKIGAPKLAQLKDLLEANWD